MKKKVIVSILISTFVIAILGFVDLAPTQAEYADLTLNRYAEQAGMPPVVFPHWFHRIRFKCKVCHEEIFLMSRDPMILICRRLYRVSIAVNVITVK